MSSAAHNSRPNRESLSKRLGLATTSFIHSRDGHRCTYCAKTAAQSGAHLHLDHLTPKSKGGADVPSNLVLACRSCNSARKDMPLATWCALRSTAKRPLCARKIRAHARRVSA